MGLRCVSGIARELPEVLARDDASARQAVELYCHRIRKYIRDYLTVVGGTDAMLFGGERTGNPMPSARLSADSSGQAFTRCGT